MPTKSSSESILAQSQVGGITNTYILGCTDKRVTFNTQQTRAFNLVWALFEEGRITSESRIAVIGGGLSGMTVAAALNLMKCKVKLFHEKENLMNIQTGNYQRYVHPNIYDWPAQGCNNNHTDFPCMNWTAGSAQEVCTQIEERWADMEAPIETIRSKRIDEVKGLGARPRVHTREGAWSEAFDCVILAVGFGIEKSFPNARWDSYWDVDNLEQPVKMSGTKQYLVSGIGDGGLIDTLRIRFNDFDHEKFTKLLLDDPELEEIKRQLIEIEEKAPENDEEFSSYMYDEYEKLDISEALKDKLRSQLRKDTKVELNGRLSDPFSPKACLINRFSIHLLRVVGAISYVEGSILSINNVNGKCIVNFKNGNKSFPGEYDEVIVRHGPKEVHSEILSGKASLPNVPDSEKIITKMWPDNFYPERTEDMNEISEADMHYKAFSKKIRRIDRRASIATAKKGEKDIYQVRTTMHNDPKMMEVKSFKGIDVQLLENDGFELASRGYFGKSEITTISVGCAVSGRSGQTGTLGCFVQLFDQRVAFISSSHLFSEKDEDKDVYIDGNEHFSENAVGTFYKKTKLQPSSDKRKQRNVADASLILVNSGVNYVRSLPVGDGMKIAVQGPAIARIGDKVLKMGAKSGLSRGVVSAVNCSIFIRQDDKEYYFEDAIMIDSLDDNEFASSGDSGAAVYRADGKILGIVFAISRRSAILCPIKDVLQELQCMLMIY